MSRLCRYAWRLSPKNQLYTTHMLPALHSGKLRPPDASLQLKCTLNVQCHFLEQFGQNQIRNINELSNIGRIWNPTVQKPDFLKVPFWMIQFSNGQALTKASIIWKLDHSKSRLKSRYQMVNTRRAPFWSVFKWGFQISDTIQNPNTSGFQIPNA